jgi:hypothetical protein
VIGGAVQVSPLCFLACHVAVKVKSAVNAFKSPLPGSSAVVYEAMLVCFLACHVTVADVCAESEIRC